MSRYFNDPLGIELATIRKVYGLDKHLDVKQASQNPEKPTINDYAYPEELLYPVNSPENTTLSYCYVKESSLPADIKERVLTSVKQAADFWGITLPQRLELPSEEPETLTFKVASGDKVDTYTIHAPGNISQIYEQITKHAADYTYTTRQQLADQILRSPSEYRTELTTDHLTQLQKIAGDMLVTSNDIKRACEHRAYVIEQHGHPELAKKVKEAAEATPEEGFAPRRAIIKIANVLDYASRIAGIKTTSGDKAYAPVEELFRGIPESDVKAFVDGTVALKNGSAVIKSRLLRKRSVVEDYFSKYAGEDIKTLSNDDVVAKVADLDEGSADAFATITELCI